MSHPFLFPFLTFPFLTLALAAQTVSPVGYDKKMSDASNHLPFGASTAFGVCRYQQAHGDLTGAPLTVKEIAFRRRAGGLNTFAGRTATLELLVGEGPFDSFAGSFAANYAAAPVVAIGKKEISLPELVATPGLQPFVAKLPLDAPWTYSGRDALLWETKVSKVVRTTVDYALDFVAGAHGRRDGIPYGTGCNAGATSAAAQLNDDDGTLRLLLQLAKAPAASSGILLLGTSDPDLAIPGLCTRLHSDGALVLSLPPTDGSGNLSWRPVVRIANSAGYAGLELRLQAFFVDPQQSPLPLSGTNGLQVAVPPPNPPGAMVHRLFLNGSATGPIGTAIYGDGLVVQFS
jgi:hypothetical protein